MKCKYPAICGQDMCDCILGDDEKLTKVVESGLMGKLANVTEYLDKLLEAMSLWSKFENNKLVEENARLKSILQSLKQSDAVEFAEWIRDNSFSQSNRNGKWYEYPVKDDDIKYYTTEELYKLFTLK